MKQRKIYKLWKQPSFQISVEIGIYSYTGKLLSNFYGCKEIIIVLKVHSDRLLDKLLEPQY